MNEPSGQPLSLVTACREGDMQGELRVCSELPECQAVVHVRATSCLKTKNKGRETEGEIEGLHGEDVPSSCEGRCSPLIGETDHMITYTGKMKLLAAH